jgi:hypothetical protein
MAIKKIKWTTEKIMSTSALFISVISLMALLYQSHLAREENELIRKQQSASVLPYLSHWYSYTGDSFSIHIGNKGVGPAFLSDVNVSYQDSLVFNKTDDLLRYLFKNNKALDSIPYSFNSLGSGYVFPADKSTYIVEIKSRENVEIFRNVFFESPLSFSIKYKDVYGDEWEITESSNMQKKYQQQISLFKSKLTTH